MIHLPHAWTLFGFNLAIGAAGLHGEYAGEVWGLAWMAGIIFCWRYLSVSSLSGAKIQHFLHARLGGKKMFVQWHSILHSVLMWEVFIAIWNIYFCDWVPADSLIFRPAAHEQLPMWLLFLVSCAPLACIGTLCVITVHMRRFAKLADFYSEIGAHDRFWQVDMMITCVMLPSWFSVTSLFSLSRMWQVVSSSMKPGTSKSDYLSQFHADNALATFVELETVLAFALLVVHPLVQSYQNDDERTVEMLCWSFPEVVWLTMNGVYFCVVTGAVQIIVQVMALVCLNSIRKDEITTEFLRNHSLGKDDITEEFLQDHCTDGQSFWLFCNISHYHRHFDTIATVGIMLCAYNMFFACNLELVQRHIPHANIKFHGTRAIIMIAQVQAKLLMPESLIASGYNDVFRFGLDGWCCALLHVALTQFEVFCVACFHLCIWSDVYNKRYHRTECTRRSLTMSGFYSETMSELDDDDEPLVRSTSTVASFYKKRVVRKASSSRLMSDTSKSDVSRTSTLQSFVQREKSVKFGMDDDDVERQLFRFCSADKFLSVDHGHKSIDLKIGLCQQNGRGSARHHVKHRGQRRRFQQGNYPWFLSGSLLLLMLSVLVIHSIRTAH